MYSPRVRLDDKTGRRFGRLTVVSLGPKSYGRLTTWVCHCDCGNQTTVPSHKLVGGHTKSCGCLGRDVTSEWSRTHGATIGRRHSRRRIPPEYHAWCGAKTRCCNPTNRAYADYGGRGITMCEQWRNDYARFRCDMGPRPSARHSLDRIDVNGNYEPGNCRWATRRQQSQNVRSNITITVDGRALVLRDAAREFNVAYLALYKAVVIRHEAPSLAIPRLQSKGSGFREGSRSISKSRR